MVVYCPGCGAKISVATDPAEPAGTGVECPKCPSRFSTAGVKAPTDEPPPPKKFRKKKPGSRLAGLFILLLVLLVLGGGAAAVLYLTGYWDRFISRPSLVTTGPGSVTVQP